MPIFEIEQYEIHTQQYKVDADNEAEAIKKHFDGESDAFDNRLEYIEVADDLGLPADNYPELAEALRQIGIKITDVIPSIRAIEKIE